MARVDVYGSGQMIGGYECSIADGLEGILKLRAEVGDMIRASARQGHDMRLFDFRSVTVAVTVTSVIARARSSSSEK